MNNRQRQINKVSKILSDRCWLRLVHLGFHSVYDYSENGLFNLCRKIIRLEAKTMSFNALSSLKDGLYEDLSIPSVDSIVRVYIEQ